MPNPQAIVKVITSTSDEREVYVTQLIRQQVLGANDWNAANLSQDHKRVDFLVMTEYDEAIATASLAIDIAQKKARLLGIAIVKGFKHLDYEDLLTHNCESYCKQAGVELDMND